MGSLDLVPFSIRSKNGTDPGKSFNFYWNETRNFHGFKDLFLTQTKIIIITKKKT